MFWHLLLEVIFLVAILFAGSPFWQCLKAPNHLRRLLADPEELKRLIAHFQYEKLVAESNKLAPPPLGSNGEFITIWDAAHYKSLASTRNLMLCVVLLVLAASGWLGIWYFAVSLSVFLLLGIVDLSADAKNNNVNHLPSVILNLIQWRFRDPEACEHFCHQTRPEYSNLYAVLAAQHRV